MQKSCKQTEKTKELTKSTPYYIIGEGRKRKNYGNSEWGPCGEPQGTVGRAIGERKARDWGGKRARLGTEENTIGELEKRRRLDEKQARARCDASEGSA